VSFKLSVTGLLEREGRVGVYARVLSHFPGLLDLVAQHDFKC
jgi:hypothetical protein